MPAERVTVTFPPDLVRAIDRLESNRSGFIQEAVRHELELRRRAELKRSLDHPHPESEEMAELGFDDWAALLPEESVDDLLDPEAGTDVCWIPGEGWHEVEG